MLLFRLLNRNRVLGLIDVYFKGGYVSVAPFHVVKSKDAALKTKY